MPVHARAVGGLAGLVIGLGLCAMFSLALPVQVSWFYVLLAEVTAIVIGLMAGVLPARRAARLDPVEALRSE